MSPGGNLAFHPSQSLQLLPGKPPSNHTNTRAGGKDKQHKMIFTDLYKSPKSPLSRLRHSQDPPLAVQTSDYDADLTSRDKTKNKEAVKRHLQAKVRNDWSFTWPPVDANGSTPVTYEPKPSDGTDEAQAPDELEGFLEVASDDQSVGGESVVDEQETASASASGDEADSETESVYSAVSEDPLHWKPRLDWTSELSEDELPYNSPSPFKFDTPDSIGQAVNASKIARKTRRRRALRKEMAWNNGLACFEARRNAWTGAKVAHVRPKPMSPPSPTSPRRALFWRTHTHPSSNAGRSATSQPLTSPLTPVTTTSQHSAHSQHAEIPLTGAGSGGSDNSTPSDNLSPKTSHSDSQHRARAHAETLPVETLLPIAPPLLPPANAMRASITPHLYNSIYDKVIVHSLQPSCPINLGDMVRACVAGWKRDGEWPPRPTAPESAAVVAVKRKKYTPAVTAAAAAAAMPPGPVGVATIVGTGAPGRKMSFSFLGGHGHGGDKDKGRRESLAEDGSGGSGTGNAIRRSLQKVLGIGQGQHPSITSAGDGNVEQEH